jgi:general secretion pathway protein A
MSQLLDHYGFTHHPFGRLTPKAAVWRHRGFEEAFRRLHFTVELDGLAVLVAEPGCGKSLLLAELADQLPQPQWAVHYLAHTTTGPFGLINVLARNLGLTPARSRSETALAVAQKLLADERRHLLAIDEAHDLPDDSLEDLRLLTIADFDRRSPFLLLLAGQPRLDERLQEPTHRALDQRVTTLARLLPLGCEEVPGYLQARLAAAGVKQPLFDDGAVRALFDASDGVPRRLNTFATTALIVAAARNQRRVSHQDVQDAVVDRGRP